MNPSEQLRKFSRECSDQADCLNALGNADRATIYWRLQKLADIVLEALDRAREGRDG